VVTDSEELDDNGDGDDDDDPAPQPPSHREILNAIHTLRRGFQCYGEAFDLHYIYEKYVSKMMEESKKQTRIDDFFARRGISEVIFPRALHASH